MKAYKKLLAFFMIFCMAVSLAACGGSQNTNDKTGDTSQQTASTATGAESAQFDPMEKYDPGLELTIASSEKDPNKKYPEGMDPEHNAWMDAYKQELGITFQYKWVVPASKYDEKLNAQIAAGDVPDFVHKLSRGSFDQLVKLGLALPLDELVDKYATDLAKEVLNSDGGYSVICSRGEDGKLYALPQVAGFSDCVGEMWIRTDWLKKLNLQAPKNLDELHALLKAFVQQDPDGNGKADTIGLITDNYIDSASAMFNAFGAQPFWSWYKDDKGVFRYSTVFNVEGLKKGLEYMQALYKEGLMHQEFGTVSYEKFDELTISGKVGIVFKPRWYAESTLYQTVLNDPNADWEAYPYPTGASDGTLAKPFAYYGPAAYNVVSTNCKNPEAAIKMFNLYCEKVYGKDAANNCEKYIMTKDGFNLKDFAILGSDWANRFDIYKNVAAAVESGDPSSLTTEEKIQYDSCMAYKNGDMNKWAAYKTYGPNNPTIGVVQFYIDNKLPMISDFYGPATEAVKQYQGDLDAKWLEVCVQIIMGQKPVSAYDDFVNEWYKLGGDKMEQQINDYAKQHPEVVPEE